MCSYDENMEKANTIITEKYSNALHFTKKALNSLTFKEERVEYVAENMWIPPENANQRVEMPEKLSNITNDSLVISNIRDVVRKISKNQK